MATEDILLSIALESNIEEQNNQLSQLAEELKNNFQRIDGCSAKIYEEDLPTGISSRTDPATIGTIIVSLASAGVFTALIQLVQTWMNGKKNVNRAQIKVQIGDNLVEFDYSPGSVKNEELLKFVRTIVDEIEDAKDK